MLLDRGRLARGYSRAGDTTTEWQAHRGGRSWELGGPGAQPSPSTATGGTEALALGPWNPRYRGTGEAGPCGRWLLHIQKLVDAGLLHIADGLQGTTSIHAGRPDSGALGNACGCSCGSDSESPDLADAGLPGLESKNDTLELKAAEDIQSLEEDGRRTARYRLTLEARHVD